MPLKHSTFSFTDSKRGSRHDGIENPIIGSSTLLTADKLQSIMSFLDEVEQTEDDIRSEVTRVSLTFRKMEQLFKYLLRRVLSI